MGSTVILRLAWASLFAASLNAATGISISVSPAGAYDITFASPAWRFGGDLGIRPSNIANTTGSDTLGDYAEISFDYAVDTPRHAAIRAYENRQAVVFSVE
jgi:hypothetical protein